jgi:hypothetical protein
MKHHLVVELLLGLQQSLQTRSGARLELHFPRRDELQLRSLAQLRLLEVSGKKKENSETRLHTFPPPFRDILATAQPLTRRNYVALQKATILSGIGRYCSGIPGGVHPGPA